MFSTALKFLKNTYQVFCKISPVWFIWCFLRMRQGLWIWVKNTRDVKCPPHGTVSEGIWYSHELSWRMLSVITWLRKHLSSFSTLKLFFFSPFYTLLFESGIWNLVHIHGQENQFPLHGRERGSTIRYLVFFFKEGLSFLKECHVYIWKESERNFKNK